MIAQKQHGTPRKTVRQQACCNWLTVEPAESWEEIEVVGHREMRIPGIEFRFVFHDRTGKLFEAIDFVVEEPAWRNCFSIRVLPRAYAPMHGAPMFLNRISVIGELQPMRPMATTPSKFADADTLVYFAHMPVGCNSPNDAQRWVFPLPLVHIARRDHVPR